MVRAVISYFWHKDKVICAVLPSHFKPSLDVFSSQVRVCVCVLFSSCRLQMKMELEWTCVLDGLQCLMEYLSAGCNSFLSYISLTPCLQSPPPDWKTHKLPWIQTHTLAQFYFSMLFFFCELVLTFITQTHASWVLLHFFILAKAVVPRCVWFLPLPSSLSPITGSPRRQKKGPLLLIPMATTLFFFSLFLRNQSDSNCVAVLPQPG